jgi:glyoxylase-like metal-dependent hydrolase (beta-lactamase superfamily II)
VVLTHHHTDHSGGLWTYLARGITVFTTPGNEALVRAIASAPRAVDGRLVAVPQPRIEIVAQRRTLGSGANAVELIDVGPNPHAAEILVAYLPGRKMLYVPDIYGYSPEFQPPEMLVAFADTVARMKLKVETFVTAHTEPTTWAQYQEGVAQARAVVTSTAGR